MNYFYKYIKYKSKYLNLKGGGLILQDDAPKITRLDGPGIYYILLPQELEKAAISNIYLPKIILFGDLHSDDEKYHCKNCICTDKSNCCYDITNIEFWQELDKLSTPANPIDVYIETFKYDEVYSFSKKNSLGYLGHNAPFLDCYKKDRSDCPTPNIKWHYIDPRHSNRHIEGCIYTAAKYFDLKFIGNYNDKILCSTNHINQNYNNIL